MKKAAAVGLAFSIGFVTQNVALLPQVKSENQPIILVALSIAGVLATSTLRNVLWSRHVQIAIFALVGGALTGFEYFTSNDLIRAFLGPAIGLGAITYLRYLRPEDIERLLYAHAIVPLIGIAAPAALMAVLTALGLRGVSYYGGYSGYFYSEPSYAATNIMFLYALRILLSTQRTTSRLDVFTAILLTLTQSATGLLFALVILSKFVTIKRFFFAALAGLAVVPFLHTPDRAKLLLDAVQAGIDSRDFYAIGLLDPSSFYRYLANAVSVAGVFIFPLGMGTFEYTRLIDLLPSYGFDGLYAALQTSDVYLTLSSERNNVAQAVPFAFATLGGCVFLFFFGFIYLKFLRSIIAHSGRLILLVEATSLFWWQSQLGSAAFWIMLAAIQFWHERGKLGDCAPRKAI